MENKTAFITGASRGVGAAVARTFHEAGAQVALASRSGGDLGLVGFTRALDHEMRELGVRVTNIAPGGIATDFATGAGRTPDMPELEEMLTADEVADVVLYTVTRPRSMRMLTVSFRPMGEESSG